MNRKNRKKKEVISKVLFLTTKAQDGFSQKHSNYRVAVPVL
jgi:hypothetical protein